VLRRKSKTQFVKQERNTQNTIALLKYLKRIAPQELTLRTQVFTKHFYAQRRQAQLFQICKKVFSSMNSKVFWICTRVTRLPRTGLNYHKSQAN
jgi:hypothetical protein